MKNVSDKEFKIAYTLIDGIVGMVLDMDRAEANDKLLSALMSASAAMETTMTHLLVEIENHDPSLAGQIGSILYINETRID